MEFVALGMATKIIMVVEDENLCLRSHLLPIVMGGGQSAHTRSHYDQIVMLIQKLVVGRFFSAPTQGVSDFVGPFVASSHTCQGRGVIASRGGGQ